MEEYNAAYCPLCGMWGGHEDGCPNGRRKPRKGAVQEWQEEMVAPSILADDLR